MLTNLYEKLINLVMFFYVFSLYMFSFREDLNILSNALALVFILLVWINILVNKKQIIVNKFLIVYLVFILISITSALVALDQQLVLSKIRTLILLFIIMITFINYINTLEKLKKLMYYFVISGCFSSIYIILTSDLTQVARFGDVLGNQNVIGVILALSSIFCFYFIVNDKKYLLIPIIMLMIFVILITGSRKALLFFVLTIAISLIFKDGRNLFNKIKYIIFSMGAVLIIYFMTIKVDFLYQIIGFRLENLIAFFGSGTTEGSINIRSNMIKQGLSWFKESPIFGYGLNNYRVLNKNETGIDLYSHNNLIELLIGIGVFGALVFYLLHIIVVINLVKISGNTNQFLKTIFVSIILSYIFLTVGLVYYDNKHFSIIIAISSIIPTLIQRNKVE